MKNKNTWFYAILFLIGIANVQTSNAQGVGDALLITPEAVFDTIFDKDGNRYALSDLDIGNATSKSTLTATCSAGYFNLYFENGSLGTGTLTQQAAYQAVFCQLFSDVSNFISSPLTTNLLNNKVNIWVRDVNNVYNGSVPPGLLGGATQFYTMPAGNKSGIVDGEVHRTIISGHDSYSNVAPPLYTLGSGITSMNGVYFHGLVTFNFGAGTNWHTTLSTLATGTEYDLYSVALHELTHALGFASLINNNGFSKFGSNFNYFSRYDKFLTQGGNPLITQTGTTCANYQYQFNPALSVSVLTVASGSCTNNVIFGGTSNQKCYCPSTFNVGSSISHFQDACHSGTFALNPGYTMNPFSINGQNRRFLQPEERNVLCDLGYNVNPNYGSTSVSQGTFAYGGSACPGIGIGGTNDGFNSSGGYTWYSTTTLTIPISSVLSNDFNATQVICPEVVFGLGSVSTSVGNLIFTPTGGYTGPVLLRYLPYNGTNYGNITYIFGFITPAACTPPDPCNIVQNGGFESITGSYQCGDAYSNTDIQLNCWYKYTITPDLFGSGCTSNASSVNSYSNTAYNLGVNTMSASPTYSAPYISTNNNHIMGFWDQKNQNNYVAESMTNYLSSPLVNGQSYKISFWAYNYSGKFIYPANGSAVSYTVNPSQMPSVFTIATSTLTAPMPASSLSAWSPTVNFIPVFSYTNTSINSWQYVTSTFTYSGSANGNLLVVGPDIGKGYYPPPPSNYIHYTLIDDVSILPVNTAPIFTMPSTVFCNNSGSVADLGQYAAPPGGTFSGPGVTQTGSLFNFSPVGLSAGVYPIIYKYVTTATPICTLTAVQQVTVMPSFTVTPMSQIIYAGQSATMTATGSTGTYSWLPGPLTGSVVVVSPSSTTAYTVTNSASGTCIVSPTIVVSTACSQSATATYSNVSFPAGTYSATGQVLNLSGTITFTGSTSFTGYTLRMSPGAFIKVDAPYVLTFDNCKVYGCSELWQGIRLETADKRQASIDVKNGTTIEDMYAGIYRLAAYTTVAFTQTGYIKITDSKLNKNYVGVQLFNLPTYTTTGVTYSLSVKNSTITSQSSLTSPGNTLKPSTIPTYTYAYNQIAGGASGSTASYTAFPRAHIGINLNNLSTTNNVVIGDSAGTANTTFNTFSNMDFGIVATNAQLRVHNNSFYNLKGSPKYYVMGSPLNPNPAPIGPAEIGIAIVAQHTVANTYSLQVGTRNGPTTINPLAIYPKSNIFKMIYKGISAKNCNVVIAKCNWFEADTTDVPTSDFTLPGSSNTYEYYKAQNAIWISALSKNATLSFNYIRNYRNGIYSSHTMSVSTGAAISCKSNYIQAQHAMGYCRQAINFEQLGGANIPANALELSNNSITKVYTGITGKNILAGLYIHNNSNLQIDNVKAIGKGSVPSTFQFYGLYMHGVQNARIEKNTNVNGINTLTSSNYNTTTAFYLQNSPSCTVTCNSTNNTGRGFSYVGNNLSPNGWMGNAMSNCYNGYELRSNGVIGAQGSSPGGTLAANTWSNVTQETYVLSSPTSNTVSYMYVAANVGSPKTSPTLNFGTTGHIYLTGTSDGIREVAGTPFDCGGGGCGGCLMGQTESMSTSSSINTSNNATYSSLSTSSSSYYALYPDEFIFMNQQYVYHQQKQGAVPTTGNTQLQSFYTSNQTSNIGKFVDATDALANGQRALAISKNNSINPANSVQQKTKRINELTYKLNVNANYSYSGSELQDLTTIAAECSIKGWYVVQARNILNVMSGQVLYYEDNCDDTKTNSRMANTEETQTITTEPINEFVLYPNPNNGQMELHYSIQNKQAAQLIIIDVTGRLISNYELPENSSNLHIHELELKAGVYFYTIKQDNTVLKQAKFVIMK